MTATQPPLVMNVGHGEYLPDPSTWTILYEVEWNEDTTDEQYADCVRWFGREKSLDPDAVESAIHEALADGWQQDIIVIPADRVGDAFASLFEQLSSRPSGDDDTYDYWPSGVRLARALLPGSAFDQLDDLKELVESVCADIPDLDAEDLI